jgi:SAM-dependent methyltransferase
VRLTGERPRRDATPRSLLALHDAGYSAVLDRLGTGRVLDVGCGEGFETARLKGAGRRVLGVDNSADAVGAALRVARGAASSGVSSGDHSGVSSEGHSGGSSGVSSGGSSAREGFSVAQMDASDLALADASFDAVCSSHLIEHFSDPTGHVAEVARVTADNGTAFFLTPNAPADFENPFHLRLFGPEDLDALLHVFFADVWVGGVDAGERVKADFASRRAAASKLLRLDVLDLRHRMPRRWYLALYTRLLPIAYALVARARRSDGTGEAGEGAFAAGGAGEGAFAAGGAGEGAFAAGGAGEGAFAGDEWFVTDDPDETTLVLFAVCREPRRSARREIGPQ